MILCENALFPWERWGQDDALFRCEHLVLFTALRRWNTIPIRPNIACQLCGTGTFVRGSRMLVLSGMQGLIAPSVRPSQFCTRADVHEVGG